MVRGAKREGKAAAGPQDCIDSAGPVFDILVDPSYSLRGLRKLNEHVRLNFSHL